MATMRSFKRKFEPAWIGLFAIGVLCGALLITGIGALHNSSQQSPAPAINQQNDMKAAPAVVDQKAGMRDVDAGEQIVSESAQSSSSGSVTTGPSNRITGPGEGLNQCQDTTTYDVSGQRFTGPGEGLNQVPH